MSWVVGSEGARAKLRQDVDNQPAIQSVYDASNETRIPPGTWTIHSTVNMTANKTIVGHGVERTTVKLVNDYPGPVFGLRGDGRWPNGRAAACPNVTVKGLTLWQTSNVSVACKVFWSYGDYLTLRNMRFRGGSYEGLYAGDVGLRANDIEAWDCGNGGPAYSNSTSGLNIFGHDGVIDGFRCIGCGQGVETGRSQMTWRNGVIASPGGGTPSLGINIGSNALGIYWTTIENCVINGYATGIQAGPNGIGRHSRLIVRNNDIYLSDEQAAGVWFAGGKTTNTVSGSFDNPYEGPDTYGSEISGNNIYITEPASAAIIYHTYPNEPTGVYGREPATISGNNIYFQLADPASQIGGVIVFGGKVSADCLVANNNIHGLPYGTGGGDIRSASITGNEAIPGMPKLSMRGNNAYGLDGRLRDLFINIEGA
jgi:hypothetical protein